MESCYSGCRMVGARRLCEHGFGRAPPTPRLGADKRKAMLADLVSWIEAALASAPGVCRRT